MSVLAVLILAGVSLAVVTSALLGRTARSREGLVSPSAMGFVGATVFGSFALLIGFTVAATWQHLNSARQQAATEARLLTETYSAAQGIPGAERIEVRVRLREYTELVVRDEWPLLRTRAASSTAWQTVDAARTVVTSAREATVGESAAMAVVARDLAAVHGARSVRLAAATCPILPGLVIGGLFTGAVFVLVTPLVIGLPANGRNLVVMCFLGAGVAFGVGLALDLNAPFAGTVQLRPDAFVEALARFEQIDAGAAYG